MNRTHSFEKAILDPFYFELRTSLTLIQTCTDLLMQVNEIDQQELRNFLQIIRRGGTRIDRLVRDFILLAKAENGVLQQERVIVPTSILPPLNLALLEIRSEIEEHGIELVVDVPETMPLVLANPDHLRIIIERLLNVLLRFSQKEGDGIVVQAHTKAESIVVMFTGEGIPINDADLTHIFELFFAPANVPISRDQHGLGLDLPVVKALIELYNGRIAIENLAAGNVFAISLPRAEPEIKP